jgi:radical SAM protein with 4Fe4S-binding SPASM domain
MAWLKTTGALTKLPKIILQNKVSFDFDGIPQVAEQLSSQRKINLIKVGIDKMLGSHRARGLPPIIQVEPTNVCNLKCPLCPTGSNTLKRPSGLMSLEIFEKILDDLGDVLIALYLFCFGEPFMHRELPKMIEMCTARNILTLTSTNGHFLQTIEEALEVVDAGLKTLIIAIDGSTQEIYQSYRKSGDVEKVKKCAALLAEAKARRGSKFPYIALRSVVTRENQEDLPNLERLAGELGADMFTYKTLGCLTGSEKYKDHEPTEGRFRRFAYAGSSRSEKPFIQCPFPFRQPIVFWDGTVVGCEYDHELEMAFGKIGERPFSEIWNSPKAMELRRSILEGRDRPPFCSPCPYQNRAQEFMKLYTYCKELGPRAI